MLTQGERVLSLLARTRRSCYLIGMRVRKSGPRKITDQQQKLILQTLKLANMRKLASTHQVESLFSALDFFGYPDPGNPSRRLYDSLNPTGDSQKESEGVKAFERDRDKLREILTMMFENETRKAIREINAGLSAVTVRMALSLRAKSESGSLSGECKRQFIMRSHRSLTTQL